MTPIERLKGFTELHGGIMAFTRETKFFNCPFSSDVGIEWRSQILFVRSDSRPSDKLFANMIHELGHLLAADKPPGPNCDELMFLGWETLVAKQVIGWDLKRWQTAVGDYSLEPGVELENLSLEELKERQKEWVNEGEAYYKNIVDGEPVSICRPQSIPTQLLTP